jgi:hypothetical protein
LTWNGYIDNGALITSQGGTSNLTAYGTDSWTAGRIQLEGKYKADNYGWAFRLRNDGPWAKTTDTSGDVIAAGSGLYFKRAWGWVDMLNGMVEVQAGRLGDYSISTNQWQSFGAFDGSTGILAKVMPVKGVTLGLFLPTWNSGTATDTVSNAFGAMALGGSYSSDMIYAAAGYDLGGKFAWLGLSYSGMKDLTAYLESKDSFGATSSYYLDEYVDYAMGNMTVGTYAEQQFGGTNFLMHFSPQFTYTMDKVVLGLRGDFATDSVSTGYGVGAYAKLNVASSAWLTFGAGYDGGTAAPTNGSQTVFDPLYGPQSSGAFATQASALTRVFIDLGTKF